MGPLGYHRPDRETEAYLADRAAKVAHDQTGFPIYRAQPDSWQIEYWERLPNVCFLTACDSTEIDQRGPVWVRHFGEVLMLKACTEHWEMIHHSLGIKASWERTDGARG